MNWRKNAPRRAPSKSRGPESGARSAYSRSSDIATVAEAERVGGRGYRRRSEREAGVHHAGPVGERREHYIL